MLYYQLFVLLCAVILIVACTPTSMPAPLSQNAASPTALSGTATALPTQIPTYAATKTPASQPATGETQIQVIIGETILTGRLWDNATARDLIAQLPLTLTFNDFHAQEKLATLPRKMSLNGVPKGDDPNPREIGYYAPSGHLVFYYTDVGYFNGIVRIGQFDGNMDAITSQTGEFTATIELAN